MPRIWRTLHASAFRQVENNEQVTAYALTFEDAARASVERAENNERAATCAQNFADAPRTSIMTRQKQREGRHLRLNFEDAPRASRPTDRPSPFQTKGNESVADQGLTAKPRKETRGPR